jgi:YHS domain-containing protein
MFGRRILAFAALIALGATLAFALPEKKQTVCPITGKPISKVSVDFQGQRIYFCSKECVTAFKADPEKVFAKFAAEGIVPENIQKTCPVSGEKLGGMGKPVFVDWKGRRVFFCCAGCKPDFQKDPAKYLAKLPGEKLASSAAPAPAAAK